MPATQLTDDNFQDTLANSDQPVFVDFYADWCGPCQMAAPVVDKLADEYRDKITIAKLDVDQNQQTAQKYGVVSIPTVIVFKKQDNEVKEVAKKTGFPGEEGYRQLIEETLA
ncbi:MAG: thioredoxin [Candidatus Pacebacteria bacterium]|nr:thioredoxin [Candidatus Paceibacterota bacterium]